ncbi:lipase [Achlya hypogyna]|uniref:Lipase n=1 Tax=Achlya hypogyna TaxID=1202772 RepID=A0A1V9ZP54_ACHHY|nr:lipase [Achlya hypogyna]
MGAPWVDKTTAVAVGIGLVGAGLLYWASGETAQVIQARMATPMTAREAELLELAPHGARHVISGDRDASLFVQTWVPDECKAIVILVHGMNEHSGYLQRLTEVLLRGGYGAVAFDHEGFGRSSGTHALVTDYRILVQDVHGHVAAVRARWPEKQIYLMGCSFGGALIVHTLLASTRGIAGVILQAPALQLHASRRPPAAAEVIGRAFAALLPALAIVPSNGGKGSSPLVRAAVSERKRADPLYYSGKVRLGTAFSVLSAMDGLQTPSAMAALATLDVPLLVQHGDADEVCALAGSQDWLAQLVGCQDKQLKAYAGACHDLLHEPDAISSAVLRDTLAWLDERCTTKS